MISLFVIAIFILRELPCPEYRQDSEDSNSMHDECSEDNDEDYRVRISCKCITSAGY